MTVTFTVDEETELAPIGSPVSALYRDAEGYDPGEDLKAAIDVALMLGMPLLLTGEPGCGKTSVAHWLAWKLSLAEPLVFNVKSLTSGRDLLYKFDELARFRDSHAGAERDLTDYVRLNALGLAILASGGAAQKIGYGEVDHLDLARPVVENLPGEASVEDWFSTRKVVLIDELDKAPRDTPNDLLAEIDEMSFRIDELDARVRGSSKLRPIVVITSNTEKSLPDPFLRRCVFHHIKAPNGERRREIVKKRGHRFAGRGHLYEEAMELFEDLRSGLTRPPGTAELLAWLQALDRRVEGLDIPSLKGHVRPTLGVLAKTEADLQAANEITDRAGLA